MSDAAENLRQRMAQHLAYPKLALRRALFAMGMAGRNAAAAAR